MTMKLGIFDSGLGGLLIGKAVREAMPDIDMVYLGDTLHLPYGNRSEDAIFLYTTRAMERMFALDCKLIVIACNTASATALRRLQQDWLPGRHPGRNILGVVVPTLEAAVEQGHKRLGLIGTNYLMHSDVYRQELLKLSPDIRIIQQATPLLVPLIENGGMAWAGDVLEHYLQVFLQEKIECLLLGCTHYPFLKKEIGKILGKKVALLSQDEIIPGKLKNYLERHPEHSGEIGRGGESRFYVSDLTENYKKSARAIYGDNITVEKTEI